MTTMKRKEVAMPGGDRTGPAGTGALTGRGLGFGAGYSIPGYMNRIPGERFSAGAGYRSTAPHVGTPRSRDYVAGYSPARGSAFRGRRGGGFGLGRGLNRRGRR